MKFGGACPRYRGVRFWRLLPPFSPVRRNFFTGAAGEEALHLGLSVDTGLVRGGGGFVVHGAGARARPVRPVR